MVAESNLLKLHGNLNEFFLAGDLEDLVSDLLDNLGPRIVAFVDSMAEPIEKLLSVLDILDELRDVFFLTDRLEHPQHCLVGASVLGTVECTCGTCN